MDYIELDTVNSTNTWAIQHLSILKPNPILCITAKEQTNGRGQHQRFWDSPKDVNLYATFVFYLPTHPIPRQNLAQILCFSCAQILNPFSPSIKWPNDILISQKKCAGVLCEIIDSTVIIGIGLNVNTTDLSHIDQPATSLYLETGHTHDILSIRNQLADQFASDIALFFQDGFAPFYIPFKKLLVQQGLKPDGTL